MEPDFYIGFVTCAVATFALQLIEPTWAGALVASICILTGLRIHQWLEPAN